MGDFYDPKTEGRNLRTRKRQKVEFGHGESNSDVFGGTELGGNAGRTSWLESWR